MNHVKGLSLTELLIALLLSSMITILLMRHYLNAKEHGHSLQMAVEQSYELQLVADLMRQSVKRAGFSPCANIERLMTSDARESGKILAAFSIADSKLQINRMSERFDTVLQIANKNQILASHYYSFQPNQFVIIADCYHAEVQQVAQITLGKNRQWLRLAQTLAYNYHDPIYIGPWIEEIYFIRRGRNAKTSLFYQLNHAEELTTVVHSLYAYIEKNQDQTLLKLKLGLEHQQELKLDTVLRSP